MVPACRESALDGERGAECDESSAYESDQCAAWFAEAGSAQVSIKDGNPDAHLWMQAALPKSHRGIFTAKAKRAGKTVQAYARAKRHAKGKLGAQARFALNAKRIAG